MVRDGYRFLIPLLLLLCGSLWLEWWAPALVLLFLFLFVAYFFRDPEREIPADETAIVSPADGKVVRLQEGDEGTLVSIFLSIFDVHVNRAPISGTILRQEYHKGKFLVAWDERASLQNEQVRYTIEGDHRLEFSLIAGIVARRILPWTKPNQRVKRGDRIALIRFGSRADILIPRGCRLEVVAGDRVRGGSSILAHWNPRKAP